MKTFGLCLTVAAALAATNLTVHGQTGDQNSQGVKPEPFGVIDCGIGQAVVVQHGSRDNVERAFISFDLGEFGDTLVIDLAELVFTASTLYDTTQPLLVMVSPATILPSSRASSWQEDWTETSGGFDPEYLASLPLRSTESEKELRVDVTEIVRRWVSGEAPNYGFVLKSLSEDKSTFLWTRDGRYKGQDAKLVIYYSCNPLAIP